MVTSEVRRIGKDHQDRTTGSTPSVRILALVVADDLTQLTPLVRTRSLPTDCHRRDRRLSDQRRHLTARLRKPHRPNNRLCLLA